MNRRYLNAKQVCERYGNVSYMSLWRWLKIGVLPQPVYMSGRRYWSEDELCAADAQRMTRKAPPNERAEPVDATPAAA